MGQQLSAERKAFPKLENVLSLQQGNSSLRLPVVLIPVQELSPDPDGMGETESGVLREGEGTQPAATVDVTGRRIEGCVCALVINE